MSVPRLTREQAAIIGAYTGFTCGPMQDVHEYAERLLNGPIGPASMAVLAHEIKKRAWPDFKALCFEETAAEPQADGAP